MNLSASLARRYVRGIKMKKLIVSIASFLGSSVYLMAGDLSEPVVTEVAEPAAAAGSNGWILPLLLVVGVIAIASSGNDGGYR